MRVVSNTITKQSKIVKLLSESQLVLTMLPLIAIILESREVIARPHTPVTKPPTSKGGANIAND